MAEALAAPRDDLSKYAPRITTLKVKPDQIRDDHRPRRQDHQGHRRRRPASPIDVEDDGTVNIASPDGEAVKKAHRHHQGPHHGARGRRDLQGHRPAHHRLRRLRRDPPGHRRPAPHQRARDKRVERVKDVCKEGDEMVVKVIGIDRDGKIRLSRREAIGKTPDVVHNFRRRVRSVRRGHALIRRGFAFGFASCGRTRSHRAPCRSSRRCGFGVGRGGAGGDCANGARVASRRVWRWKSRSDSRDRCARARGSHASRRDNPQRPGTIDADYRGEVVVLLVNLVTNHIQSTRAIE